MELGDSGVVRSSSSAPRAFELAQGPAGISGHQQLINEVKAKATQESDRGGGTPLWMKSTRQPDSESRRCAREQGHQHTGQTIAAQQPEERLPFQPVCRHETLDLTVTKPATIPIVTHACDRWENILLEGPRE